MPVSEPPARCKNAITDIFPRWRFFVTNNISLDLWVFVIFVGLSLDLWVFRYPEEAFNGNEISSTEEISNKNETLDEISSQAGTIQLLYISSPIGVNQTATIKIQGVPNTKYSIKVMYSTTASSAKGLEDKISDENGLVEWSWKIGTSVKAGEYRITVSDSDNSFSTTIVVIK